MESILQFANQVSPLGIAAILAIIIWQLVKSGGIANVLKGKVENVSTKNITDFNLLNEKLDMLGSNHLSGLPEMTETLKRIEMKSDKMNDTLIEILTTLRNK